MSTHNNHPSRPSTARGTSLIGVAIAGAILLAALVLGWSGSTASAAEYRAFWVDGWEAGYLTQSQVDTLLGVPGKSSTGQIRDANCNAAPITSGTVLTKPHASWLPVSASTKAGR